MVLGSKFKQCQGLPLVDKENQPTKQNHTQTLSPIRKYCQLLLRVHPTCDQMKCAKYSNTILKACSDREIIFFVLLKS